MDEAFENEMIEFVNKIMVRFEREEKEQVLRYLYDVFTALKFGLRVPELPSVSSYVSFRERNQMSFVRERAIDRHERLFGTNASSTLAPTNENKPGEMDLGLAAAASMKSRAVGAGPSSSSSGAASQSAPAPAPAIAPPAAPSGQATDIYVPFRYRHRGGRNKAKTMAQQISNVQRGIYFLLRDKHGVPHDVANALKFLGNSAGVLAERYRKDCAAGAANDQQLVNQYTAEKDRGEFTDSGRGRYDPGTLAVQLAPRPHNKAPGHRSWVATPGQANVWPPNSAQQLSATGLPSTQERSSAEQTSPANKEVKPDDGKTCRALIGILFPDLRPEDTSLVVKDGGKEVKPDKKK